jgi:hypothetical protein
MEWANCKICSKQVSKDFTLFLLDVERYSDKYREQKPETSAKWEPGAISILHSICF